MKHLTIDEIIAFVSICELNDETKALSAKVNAHVSRCKKCLELVNAYQLIYDEFDAIGMGCSFNDYVIKRGCEEGKPVVSDDLYQ